MDQVKTASEAAVAALVAHVAMAGEALDVHLPSLTSYLVETAAQHALYTRLSCPESFDALQLLTYQRGVPTAQLLERAARAAGLESADLALGQAAQALEADGIYTGIDLGGAGASAMLFLLDATAEPFTVFDVLGTLGVSSAVRTAAASITKHLDPGWTASFGGRIGAGGAGPFELVLRRRLQASEAKDIGQSIAGLMRTLDIPAMHCGYVAENFGMFTPPPSAHEVHVRLFLTDNDIAAAIDIEHLHLPSRFAVDVMIDFGNPQSIGSKMGRLEGVLGREPDGDGTYWVDGMTLRHAGEAPPRTTLTWALDAEQMAAEAATRPVSSSRAQAVWTDVRRAFDVKRQN